MKRFLAILFGIIMTFSLAACGNGSDGSVSGSSGFSDLESSSDKVSDSTSSSDSSSRESTSQESGASTQTSKILVAYFSGSGNTERVAGYIAEATGGTLFKLVPVTPYTSADLDYSNQSSRVVREHNDEKLRDIPLEKTTPDDFGECDVVFIGYPIWWGIAAWPVNNFVKNNDFTGKTVIPFATSASSGMGQSGTLLRNMSGTGNWLAGQRFSSGESKSTVENYVKGLNLAA